MKKLISIFVVLSFAMASVSQAAVNIKKAPSVSTKKTSAAESATSLLPTVIGLVGSVKTLQAQQQQLSADCAPTSDEISTVNDLVKEWAKLGETSAESAASGLGQLRNGGYQGCLEYDDGDACYETFVSSADKGTVWENFPKVSSGKKCKDGNSKNCTSVSNIYDIFERIPFTDADYTKAEAKKIAKLKEKAERCAPSKLKAAKAELLGGFVTQTLSSVGHTTGAAGTTGVLEAVTSLGGGSDIKSMLPSLGQMAMQTLDK